jgi:ubiquinone/menaquinone biosynthesis C-methylase UbiE
MVEKEAVIRGYDDVADAYEEARSPSDEEREALTSFLEELSSESRVLDAGCGGGEPVLQQLLGESQQAIGMDLSAQQLEKALSNAPDARLLRGDMSRIPLAEDTVDAVLAYHSLIHVPADEHQTVIEEFARVLRPGGQLLVSEGPGEWQGTNPDWLDTGAEMQWYVAGAEATRRQLETAGFQIENEYGAPNTLADGEDASWVFFDTTLTGT